MSKFKELKPVEALEYLYNHHKKKKDNKVFFVDESFSESILVGIVFGAERPFLVEHNGERLTTNRCFIMEEK